MPQGLLQGLMLAAVAVVAHAVWGMARSYAPSGRRLAWAAAVGLAAWVWPGAWAQPVLIALSAGWGAWAFRQGWAPPASPLAVGIGRRAGAVWLGLFGAGLAVLPMLAQWAPGGWWPIADAFYRIGALIFGGGHVVLPLIQAEVVGPGWIRAEAFLAGYGAVQAMPGPMLTISSYVGTALTPRLRPMLDGVHAGVVGLLAATLGHAAHAAIDGAATAVAAAAALVLLRSGRVPVWALVGVYAVAGGVMGRG